jgi:hypothetical protein
LESVPCPHDPCQGIQLSVSQPQPRSLPFSSLPPSPWAGMRVVSGRGLLNKACSGLPLQLCRE